MHKRKNLIFVGLLAIGLLAANLIFLYRSGLAYRAFRWQDYSEAYMPAKGGWVCWDDGNGNPCREDLNGVAFSSETDGWAVGTNGLLLHWNGIRWADWSSPVTSYLNAVDTVSVNDAWAVGSSGTILHWNGGAWATAASPTLQDLASVEMLAWNEGWAVGGGWQAGSGVVLHWNGTAWIADPIPSFSGLNDIDILGTGEGWAVGQTGTILHRKNGVWEVEASQTTEYLNSVSMVSATDGWAVGDNGVLLHWNGVSWQLAVNPDPDLDNLYAVHMLTATDGWASGFHGTLLHWNGNQWSDQSVEENAFLLNTIEMLSATSGWTVGNYGDIWRWNGATWVRQGRSSTPLTDIVMTDADHGWAVGGWPDSAALQWDGTTWKSIPVANTLNRIESVDGGGGGLSSVDAASAADGWAGSVYGQLFRWDGQQWVEWASPVTSTITDLDVVSESNVWATALGEYRSNNAIQAEDGTESYVNGRILHWDGSTWRVAQHLPDRSLNSIFMLGADNGWAAGFDTLLQWNASTWLSHPIPFTQTTYTSLNMLSTTDGWALASGKPVRWNGAAWQAGPAFEGATYGDDLTIVTADDGWMIGSLGKDGSDIQHWDGAAWRQMFNPAPNSYLSAIHMIDAYEGWAVGYGGLILHYTAPRPILSLNYPNGAVGSFFTVTGANFAPDVAAHIFVNGHEIGMTTTDASGGFAFLLSTDQADLGKYLITVTVNSSASVPLELQSSAPLRTQETTGTIINLPKGIAMKNIFMPLIVR